MQPRAAQRQAADLRIAEDVAPLRMQNPRRRRRRNRTSRCSALDDGGDRAPRDRRNDAHKMARLRVAVEGSREMRDAARQTRRRARDRPRDARQDLARDLRQRLGGERQELACDHWDQRQKVLGRLELALRLHRREPHMLHHRIRIDAVDGIGPLELAFEFELAFELGFEFALAFAESPRQASDSQPSRLPSSSEFELALGSNSNSPSLAFELRFELALAFAEAFELELHLAKSVRHDAVSLVYEMPVDFRLSRRHGGMTRAFAALRDSFADCV